MIFSISCILFLFVLMTKHTNAKCEHTYLTDLDETDIVGISFEVNQFQQYGYSSMLLGDGNTYNEFFVVHPPANTDFGYVSWDLNGEYQTFSAVIGLDGLTAVCVAGYGKSTHADGIKYKFYVDNILKYTSKQLKFANDFENVHIDVTNGNILKVEIYKGTNNWCDHAIIANPVLTCAPDSPCQWSLVYEHSEYGVAIFGSVDDLIADIHSGKDVRIVGDCMGDCTWIITQPSRIWTRPNGRVYIFADDTISMGWGVNDDPFAAENRLYKTVFDTSGRIQVYTNNNAEGGIVSTTVAKYPAKWFTRG